MAWWVIGIDHLVKDVIAVKGVNFNGIQDKAYAPTPNEGNRCAYERCALGYAIAEGSAARFALVGIPNQWCHKACAEDWELAVRSGAPGAAPAPIEPPCGAPHPEVKGVSCTRVAHPGGNHLDGHGGGWYMDAKEVGALTARIAAMGEAYVQPVETEELTDYAAGHQAGVDNTRIGERQDLWVDGPTTPHGRTEEHTVVINAIDAVTGVRPEQDPNWSTEPPPPEVTGVPVTGEHTVLGGPTEAELQAFADEPEGGDGAQVVLEPHPDEAVIEAAIAAYPRDGSAAGVKVTSTTPGSNVTTIHRVQSGRIDLGAAVTRLQAECDLMRDALGDAGIDVEDLLRQGHP